MCLFCFSYAQFSGFHGLLGALLVAVKQIMPDHELKLLGFLQLKTKVGTSIAPTAMDCSSQQLTQPGMLKN